jgi:hypothetical protein
VIRRLWNWTERSPLGIFTFGAAYVALCAAVFHSIGLA